MRADTVELRRVTERKDEYRADWNRNLTRLLLPGAERPFDEVWDAVVGYLAEMAEGLGHNHKGVE